MRTSLSEREDGHLRIFEGFQKGVNLGGWLSQFDAYDKAHFDNFITEKDIRSIAALGFDHVRVPVDYIVLEDEDGTAKEDGFLYLDQCRQWCEAAGLNMLIDLHECFGYSFDPLKKGMDRERFFYDADLQKRFLSLWKKIGERFAAWPKQVAFEPLNEVVLMEVAEAWNKVAADYIKLMRTVAPDSYLVIGGVCYSSVASVPLLNIPLDDKIVYNFHCYEPFVFTHQGAYWVDNMPSDFRIGYPESEQTYREALMKMNLAGDLADAVSSEGSQLVGEAFFERIFAPALEKAQADQIPLYCGEYGVIDLADKPSALRWLKDIHAAMSRHGIGRALWNYKKKDFGFEDESFSSIREDFIKIL